MKRRGIAVLLSVLLLVGTPGVLFVPENVQAKKVPPKKIILSQREKTLTVGDTYKISYEVKGKKKANKKVLFSSSRKKIASVSKKGVVKAKKAGTAVITLRAKAQKSIRNTITIKVEQQKTTAARMAAPLAATASMAAGSSAVATILAPTGIVMPATLELEPGEQRQLTATLEPATAEGEIRYSTTFRGGINVYTNGNIVVTDDTPPGTTAVITAACGHLRATCQLTIINSTCQHTWNGGSVTSQVTCTTDGLVTYTCTKCGKARGETVPATGHVWDGGTVTKEPDCAVKGVREYSCTKCQTKKTEDIPVKGHTWGVGTVVTEPTCTNTGKRSYECTECGTKKTEKIPANGHVWDGGEVTKQPGCETPGTITYSCTVEGCRGTQRESIPANGHLYNYGEITKEPACEQPGVRISECQTCGNTIRISIPATGHNYNAGTVLREPSCTRTGVTRRECLTCGHAQSISTKQLGHDWDEDYTVDEEPTCRKNGSKSIHCSRCSAIKGGAAVIKALGHDWGTGTVKIPATCITEGLREYKCQRDGCISSKEEVISATGHNYEENITLDVVQTCDTPGQESRHCTECDAITDVHVIPADGHRWSAWTQKSPADCTTAGERARTCQVCSKEETAGIPATGHNRNASGTCANCGDTASYEKTVAADWGYTLNETDKIITLRLYKGTKEYIIIPKTLDVVKEGVTTTYTVAFKECEGRESTGIFTSNSRRCEIKGVSLDADMQIEDMKYFFYSCKSLEEVSNLPSAVKKLYATFKNCESLVSVSGLPEGIEEMKNTFEGCTSLQAAPTIPDSVTNLYAAFKDAKNLTAAPVIPAGVSNMSWTFSGCESLLMPPELPEALTEMTNTFHNCTSLWEVPATIPKGVKRLTMTFYGCTSLTIAPAVPSTVEVMEYTYKNCTGLTYAAPIPSAITKTEVFAGCPLLN
ncbi:MAG: Ig-like domain-containing protein [Lachnospiraceae bacterium]|nr:Ig-like domain-containing protein [Lachnospiraceae bacterium]